MGTTFTFLIPKSENFVKCYSLPNSFTKYMQTIKYILSCSTTRVIFQLEANILGAITTHTHI